MRRTAWWSLLVAAVCVAAGLASAVYVVVSTVDGYDGWADGSTVPLDGAEHRIWLPEDATALVWHWAGDAAPPCTIRDAETGREVTPRSVSGWERPGGSMPYVAERAFTSPGDVVVRCERTSYDGALQVERRPFLPAPVHRFGVPLLLGGVAVLAGLVGFGARVVRPSREPELAEISG